MLKSWLTADRLFFSWVPLLGGPADCSLPPGLFFWWWRMRWYVKLSIFSQRGEMHDTSNDFINNLFPTFTIKCLMNILASVLLFFILFWMSFKEPPLMTCICYHFYYQSRYRRMWNWWGWSSTWAVWRKRNLFERHRQLHLPVWARLPNKGRHSDIFCWVIRWMCW